MKRIKSRWFAMLLILSLVFTMGMPMGMTAFGDTTTGEVIDNTVPADPAKIDPEVKGPEEKSSEEKGSEETNPIPVQKTSTQEVSGGVDATDLDITKTITLNVGDGGVAVISGTLIWNGVYTPGPHTFPVLPGTDVTVTAYANAGYAVSGARTQTTTGTADAALSVSFATAPAVHELPSYATDGSFSGYNALGTDISGNDPKDDVLTATMAAAPGAPSYSLGQTAVVNLTFTGVDGDGGSQQLNEVDFYDTAMAKKTVGSIGNDSSVSYEYAVPATEAGLLADGYVKDVRTKGVQYFTKAVSYEMVDRYNDTAAAAVLATASAKIVVGVTNANLTINVDDEFELYIDGERITDGIPNYANWSPSDTIRVYFDENTALAVKGRNYGGPTGLKVKVDFDDSTKPSIITSPENWLCRKSVEGNEWYKSADLTGWVKPVALSHPDLGAGYIWTSTDRVVEDSYFRYGTIAPAKVVVSVEAGPNGIAYFGPKTDPLVVSKTVTVGSNFTIKAEPMPGYSFDYWTVNGEKSINNPGATYEIVGIKAASVFKAHFVKNYAFTLELDPADGSINVPKNKVLKMTFSGMVNPWLHYRSGSVEGAVTYQNTFRIYNADGTIFASFDVNERMQAITATDVKAADGTITLTPIVNPVGSSGSIYTTDEGDGVVVLDPGTDFVPGASYYVGVNPMEIINTDIVLLSNFEGPNSDLFEGFSPKEVLADNDWNFTIASDSTSGGPSTPGSTQTTTTTERDRADRAVETTNIEPQAVPQGLPAVVAPAPAAPAQIVEEAIPLGVPVLPKTGEIPASLFYGIGGILAAAGAFMKRK